MKLKMMETTAPVVEQLSNQHKNDMKLANKHLCIIVTAIRYLSRQNLALRGSTCLKASSVVVYCIFLFNITYYL